ncbi:serine/threonine-protein kinase [Streptomyces sp. B6B3]|uniref:serine/threonine-protein kinase n=1 Tax=Streptomyces sp. B6B3 TaxID=3153570 RepID=UPI00325F6562
MRPGDEFAGRFVLRKVIGAGRSGDVWLAHDRLTGQDVALKPERTEGDRGTEERRLLGEPRAMAKFRDHPHVVTLLDVAAVDPDETGVATYWFIMEYVPGGGLDRQAPIPPERVARIGVHLADALAALHEAGIVHCDLKPANVGLSRRGDAKLLDFGAAYRFGGAETVSVNGPFSFTPDYAAPELARGNIPRPASDVFGLAATLYALVTGSPPRGDEPAEDEDHGEAGERREDAEAAQRLTYWKAEQGVVELDADALGPLYPVLAAMLQRDPRQRPDAVEAGRMLAAVAADPDARPTEDTPPKRPRRRWPAPAVAAGVAALVLGLGLVLVPGGGEGNGAHETGETGGTGQDQPEKDPPNGEQESVIGDPRTVDVCALSDPTAFSAYGRAEVDEDYGNFDRCDTYVYLVDETRVDVALRLLRNSPSGKTQPDRFIGETGVMEEPQETSECLLTLVPPGGDEDILVGIRVDVGQGAVDAAGLLCGIAEVAAENVADELNAGQVPRRSEDYPEDSLARLDACAFLDAEALSVVPGVDPEAPKRGVANWDCEWFSDIDNLEAELIFHRDQRRDGPDVRRFNGYDTTVAPRGDGPGTCTAFVHYREYQGQEARVAFEMLRLRVGGERLMDELCDMAATLAESAAARLPTP